MSTFSSLLTLGFTVCMAGCMLFSKQAEKKVPLEKEIKLSLTKDSYEKLLNFASQSKHKKSVLQKNVYFDDSFSTFKSMGVNIRVRLKDNDTALFTIKIDNKRRGNSGFFSREEYECSFNNYSLAKSIASGASSLLELGEDDCNIANKSQSPIKVLRKIIESSAISSLDPKATSLSSRTSFNIRLKGKNYLFEIDHTKFPRQHEGFELEVEVDFNKDNEAKDNILSFLKEKSLRFKPSTLDKSQITFLVLEKKHYKMREQGYILQY